MVVVAAIRLMIVSSETSGLPRQFWLMKEKRRCSILFHLLVPGGRWQTLISSPVCQVPRCRVQRLMRDNGIQGAKRRGKPWRTTKADPQARRRPDLAG